MRSPGIRNKEKKITIYLNELNQLVFWASVALKSKVRGGQFYPEVLETVKELKKLHKCPTVD